MGPSVTFSFRVRYTVWVIVFSTNTFSIFISFCLVEQKQDVGITVWVLCWQHKLCVEFSALAVFCDSVQKGRYCRTSVVRTLIARLQQLFQTCL